MEQGEITCPKCKAAMQEGFPFEQGGHTVAKWVEGRPEYQLGVFLKKPRHDKRLPIKAYRCSSCGYLESYAK